MASSTTKNPPVSAVLDRALKKVRRFTPEQRVELLVKAGLLKKSQTKSAVHRMTQAQRTGKNAAPRT